MSATTDASLEQATAWLSPARLSIFLDAAGGDHRSAIALYVWHARLASACAEAISYVEVLVRNAIHHALEHSQPEGGLHSWLVDPDVLAPPELTAVTNVITRIRRRRRPLTEDRVIAGLPLSFWARLVGTGYDELWTARLHQAFSHGSRSRKDIAGQLNRVSHLRNDIAHHKSLIDVPVEARYRDLLDLAAAVDPAAATWIEGMSRVPEVLAER